MKEITILFCAMLLISCSKSDDDISDNAITDDHEGQIVVWKLISIKNNDGNEISTPCNIENGKITLTTLYHPQNAVINTSGVMTEGIDENSTCQSLSTDITSWSQYSTTLLISTSTRNYNCSYDITYDNGITYLSIVYFLYTEGGVEYYPDTNRIYKYMRESFQYIN